MAHPNTKIPTEKTVRRDFETGTVQPGPGMAPDQPPAEDMKGPGDSEEFRKPGPAGTKTDPSVQQKKSSSCGGCGCG
jgi:hypothetical protein